MYSASLIAAKAKLPAGAARARTALAGGDEVELHFGANTVGAGLTLEARDALFEQLAIELEADTGDVAALLRAEQIACTAKFEVAHRNAKACAELIVLLERVQALSAR